MIRMVVVRRFKDFFRRLTEWLPSVRRRNLMVTIPVHILAFALLYFGTMRIVQNEILRSHSTEARRLLAEAIHSLHPLMCSADRTDIPRAISRFAASHRHLELEIFRRSGALMEEGGAIDPRIATFLAGEEQESFHFDHNGRLRLLNGVFRLRSEGTCTECHERGAVLGAATMRLDLTEQVDAVQLRLGRNLAMLIAGWLLLVALVNLGLSRITRRSLARMELSRDRGFPPGGGHNAPGLILDPVSAELYDSLRDLLKQQHTREEEVDNRLHRAERMASVGQIAAGLAHEIKNPLAGIRGVIELMRDDSEDASQRHLYEQMVTELDRVNTTIHSLLSFARPVPPKLAATDVETLIEDSLRLIRPNLERRDIALEITIAPEVGLFRLDPTHMRHVLINLVNNAAEALESNGKIAVRGTLSPGRDGLIIAVEDDGPGIPEESQSQIFEPFYTTKFTGTGLGLAVVCSLVKRHGGRIELKSEVGQGTTFFVILTEETAEVEPGTTATEDL